MGATSAGVVSAVTSWTCPVCQRHALTPDGDGGWFCPKCGDVEVVS